jgi:hypothetical protein
VILIEDNISVTRIKHLVSNASVTQGGICDQV